MKQVQLLDCTLRDGGYLVDAQFGNTVIKGIIKGLSDSGIDVVECGFLKDEPHEKGSTIFNNAAQLRSFLPEERRQTSYVCLADYSRYTISNLEPFDGTSIDGVRACFFKKERYDVIEFCREIVEKGYKLYVQPVDILGYSDAELLELLDLINPLEPYAFSIVDTFGSMYKDDLRRVFYLIDRNLNSNSRIGFHSHNNLQMSFSLSQEFIDMTQGLRKIVIDATMAGMGRGAGNTNTELVMQYMNRKYNSGYDIDTVLDLIDNYIDGIRNICSWGYSTHYFLAGSYSAHVNNISYLTTKAGISSRDINYILNRIGPDARKRYDYDLLEKTYMEYSGTIKNDEKEVAALKKSLQSKDIVMLLPGHSLVTHRDEILEYCTEKKPVVISVNLLSHDYPINYVYFSNKKRYNYWRSASRFQEYKKIVTSNVTNAEGKNQMIIDFTSLVKCGWDQLDNSGILLLRLLDKLEVASIAMAGFDGYSHDASSKNYMHKEMEKTWNTINADEANRDVQSMLEDYINTRHSDCPVFFLTPSRFEISQGEK